MGKLCNRVEWTLKGRLFSKIVSDVVMKIITASIVMKIVTLTGI